MEISEAQLTEATDIFGTDFMEAMGREDDDIDGGRDQYREEGVGVDLGIGSDGEEVPDDLSSSGDDSDNREMFQDGDDDDYEAVRKRKEARRAEKRKRRQEERKARLRRVFEPVQLVENFCTDRDEEIRNTDVPERYFDKYRKMPDALKDAPKAGEEGYRPEDFTEEEEEEATWIMDRIPAIAAEFFSPPPPPPPTETGETDAAQPETPETEKERTEKNQTAILHSIIHALRYLRREKLEPEFISRYRADYVTSPAVRENLHTIVDEDVEWDRAAKAQEKVESLLDEMAGAASVEEAIGSKEEKVVAIRSRLTEAQERLDESVKEEDRLKVSLGELGGEVKEEEDEDEDDELFGDDDSDDDSAKGKKAKNTEERKAIQKDLQKSNTLVTVCTQQVADLTSSLKEAEENVNSHSSEKSAIEIRSKMCSSKIWNAEHYKQYLRSSTDYRHAMDMYAYLSLINEGNAAIRGASGGKNSDTEAASKKKRSKRSDRDYYRTCITQGLRSICYQFVLSPLRVGIKLEDSLTKPHGFDDWSRTLPGEDEENALSSSSSSSSAPAGPEAWNAPTSAESTSPGEFATRLIDSGELVLLSTTSTALSANDDSPELKDPLRGCRYVAALELANEPRIRRHLRTIYRSRALLTSHPTKKGLEEIDAFHEYYGLHLLRNKKLEDHFPPDEHTRMQPGYTPEEQREYDEGLQRNLTNSCLQYMSLLKAEASGHVTFSVHLPLLNDDPNDHHSWFRREDALHSHREAQNLSPLLDELERVYLPLEYNDRVDSTAGEWNEQRKKILRQAVTAVLLPKFEAEARRDLREAATKVAVEEVVKSLSRMAMEGPYRPTHLLGESRFLTPTGDLPMVGVCVAGDGGRDATYLAAVNELGALTDNLGIPSGTTVDGPKMKDKVIKFLMATRPSAIVVGTGGGLRSRFIMRKLGGIVNQALERWNNRKMQGQDEENDEFYERDREMRSMYNYNGYDDEDVWNCNVEMLDDNVPQLFGRSVRGKKEFPDLSVNLRTAISTARYAKDPLSEITYAWSAASDIGVFGTEMFYLNIHPLQPIIPKALLLKGYERALCQAVGAVGVDVNRACKHTHLHGSLSFVPGFGPRKAASLKQKLDRSSGMFDSRTEILQRRLVGPVVYNNAVAFLRVRPDIRDTGPDLSPLDDTRLHPEEYGRAKKVAVSALDGIDKGDSDKSKKHYEIAAVRDIMHNSKTEVRRLFQATKAKWLEVHSGDLDVTKWNPKTSVDSRHWRDKVEDLDLDAFAKMIEKGNKGKHLTHLNMIKEEFRFPFEDPRNPLEPLHQSRLFQLLTGESDQTICPGREITGRVYKNSDFGAHVKLDNDLPGFIPLRNLADGHVESADDVVQPGKIVSAVVIEVKKDHLSVELSLRKEDLSKPPGSWERPESLLPLDMSFDRVAALAIDEENRKKRLPVVIEQRGPGGRVTKRACSHPAFRNAQHAEVDRELKDGGELMTGEALIRPSSKEADNLVLHWVVRPGVIKIITVLEEDKESDISLGNVLKIKNESYGDIDELLARYIQPLNERVEEVTHHRKFLDARKEQVEQQLTKQKKANPKGIFYFLSWSDRYPGCISLTFIINSIRKHIISISVDGFVWNKKTFSEMDHLLNSFKKNPSGQAAPPQPKPRANRWGANKPAPPPPSSRSPPPPSSSSSNGASWGGAAASTGGWNNARPPPPSLPLPPPVAYPPMAPPGQTAGWGAQRSSDQQQPPPPALPPPPPPFAHLPPPPRAPQL